MTSTQPPRLPPCPLCQGRQVGNLGLMSQYAVGLHPRGRNLWARPLSGLAATVCLNCGHTMFVADELPKLRAEAEQHPERFTW